MSGNSVYLPKKDLWEGGSEYAGAVMTGTGAKTFTVPENVKRVHITMAAGGGGGGAGIQNPFANNGGSGGAGGEVVTFWYEVPNDRILNFNLGAGGAGVLGSAWVAIERGANGGDTSFLNEGFFAKGGQGGQNGGVEAFNESSTGNAGLGSSYTNFGGACSGGPSARGVDANATGTHGGNPGSNGLSSPYAQGGIGGIGAPDCRGGGAGGASLGPGGNGGISTNIQFFPTIPATDGTNGINGGGGGGGGGDGATDFGARTNGGNGGNGMVIVRWVTGEVIY